MRSYIQNSLSLALFLITAGGPSLMAAEPSGIAIKVRQGVDVARASGQSMLRETAPVFMGDVIRTDQVGETQIRLSDDTKLVVGPNSLMTIDRFVFNTGSTAKQVSLNAVRGAFRFITGGSPKDAYTITTPTATIGVRGTKFDFTVNRSGTNLAVFDGAADMCDRLKRTQCQRQVSNCGVAVAAPNEQIRRIEDKKQRVNTLTQLFPFVIDQRRLAPAFQVDTSSCEISRWTLNAARIEARLRTDSLVPRDSETTGSAGPVGDVAPPSPQAAPPPPPSPPPPPPCNPCN